LLEKGILFATLKSTISLFKFFGKLFEFWILHILFTMNRLHTLIFRGNVVAHCRKTRLISNSVVV